MTPTAPGLWSSTFFFSGRREVWPLAVRALWRATGPCHLIAVLGLPLTLVWLIVSAIRTDLGDLPRRVSEQQRQQLCVTDIVGAGAGAGNLQSFCVNAEMEFAPRPSVAPTVLPDFPFPFAVDFDSRRITTR